MILLCNLADKLRIVPAAGKCAVSLMNVIPSSEEDSPLPVTFIKLFSLPIAKYLKGSKFLSNARIQGHHYSYLM